MIERKWPAVPPRLLTANGTATGLLKVTDTAGFYTKQTITLVSASNPTGIPLQVQEVVDPTTMWVGPRLPSKVGRQYGTDVSMFTVADTAYIYAGEQDKQALPPPDDHYTAIYASDPIVADRVILVDKYGRYYDPANPMPTIPGGTQLKPSQYDDVKITRDCDDYPLAYEFYLNTVLVGAIDVTYNCDKFAIDYKKRAL